MVWNAASRASTALLSGTCPCSSQAKPTKILSVNSRAASSACLRLRTISSMGFNANWVILDNLGGYLRARSFFATLIIVATRQIEPLSFRFQPSPFINGVSCQLRDATAFRGFPKTKFDHVRRLGTHDTPDVETLASS